MNVKEALETISRIGDRESAWHEMRIAELKAFLECHEKYKPLVEALESIKSEIESDQIQISTFNKFNLLNVLNHYRKEILGEK